MIDPLVTAILAWLHIFFAVAWLGGGLLFGFVIGPGLGKLSRPASGEFFLKVVPRVMRFFRIVPGLAILFGLLLLYAFTNGDLGQVSLTTGWGIRITIGMTIGLAAFLIGELLAVPYFRSVIKMLGKAPSGGTQGPSAEFLSTMKKARVSSTVAVLLLIITLVFMVGSAFY